MKKILFLLFLPLIMEGQIVNIEKERLADSLSNHWSLNAEFSFGLSNNSAGRNLEGSGQLRLDYFFKEKNKFMLMGAFGVNRFKANGTDNVTEIENNNFIHLRYNRDLTNWLTWEAFTQAQINEVELVLFRWLIGTGPRFRILKKDKGHIYFGSLYMFEKSEEQVGGTEDVINYGHHRLSNYLSMQYNLNDKFSLSHVTYYQPRVDNFNDFRIASETGIEIHLVKNLTWNTYFECVYDSYPPISVIELRYQIINSLALTFGGGK